MAQIDQADMPGKMRVGSSFLLKVVRISMYMFLCLEQLVTILWVYLFEIYFWRVPRCHWSSSPFQFSMWQYSSLSKKLGGFKIHGDLPHCALEYCFLKLDKVWILKQTGKVIITFETVVYQIMCWLNSLYVLLSSS